METANLVEQIFGSFYGSALDNDQCEVLTIANIDRKLLSAEAGLFRKKWFDYRSLHPAMATYLFTHHFNRAYGDFVGEYFDRNKRFMKAFKGKDFMDAREKKSFWKARQKADEMGVRYEFFAREAIGWCGENGWHQPPRPSHVASNPDILLHVANSWENEQRTRVQWAKDPRFTAQEFAGSPDQVAYEEYLLGRLKSRPHPHYGLHAALYVFDALRIEAAIEQMAPGMVCQALEHENFLRINSK